MPIEKNRFGGQIPGWNGKCDKSIELYLQFRHQLMKGGIVCNTKGM